MARPLRGGGGGKGLATKKKDFFWSPEKSPKNIVATMLEGGGKALLGH